MVYTNIKFLVISQIFKERKNELEKFKILASHFENYFAAVQNESLYERDHWCHLSHYYGTIIVFLVSCDSALALVAQLEEPRLLSKEGELEKCLSSSVVQPADQIWGKK